ncbi:fused MFS/spermidine synthase [Candidatus Obscuribacterales bacterium]|nr:fused MFS/spermidine synthase [Candidatus Obscuribacterales bacterium]
MNSDKSNRFELLYVTIYGGALICSSFLMFFIEPFVAKLLLPIWGGGPGVWNTCVLFFQIVLLLGYLYAHFLSKLLKPSAQLAVQMILVWLSACFLPIRIWQVESSASANFCPTLSLFISVGVMVGGAFFSISTTAPLLQRWFSDSRFARSADPYFLFAASNLGGLAGLLSYPFLIEPNFSLAQQGQFITIGYVCFGLLVSIAGSSMVRRHRSIAASNSKISRGPKVNLLMKWLLLSAVPSSLVLGLTEHVTGELSAIPLFWIVPLAIYLISFIIVFGRSSKTLVTVSTALAPPLVAVSLLLLYSENIYQLIGGNAYITTGVSVQLLTLFAICVACHGKIAAERPESAHLTIYYFAVSLGGVLGSAFNALVAPVVLKGGHEYSIVLMLAAILLSQLPAKLEARFAKRTAESNRASLDYVIPPVVLLISAVCWYSYAITRGGLDENIRVVRPESGMFEVLLRVVIPVGFCILLARTNRQYRLGLLALSSVVLLHLHSETDKRVVYKNRNFFARLAVSTYNNAVELWNGANLHGTESLNPLKRGIPDSYMYTDGPIGLALNELDKVSFDQPSSKTVSRESISRMNYVSSLGGAHVEVPPIAVMGLGCGVAACLAKAGQKLVFYEINPQVVEVAENPFFFTYIYEARKRKADIKVVTGDARISLQGANYGAYRLIIGDAFSGSFIPTHLLTVEALRMYLKKLHPNGVMAFNVTGYFDLKRVLVRAAAELGLSALTIREYDRTSDERDYIEWVMLVKSATFAESLRKQGWVDVKPENDFQLWTDDYSNPLKVLKERFS